MNADRFKRCRAIFEEIVELPADQRADALAARCGDDLEMRSAVARLLGADDSAEEKSFLGRGDVRGMTRDATDLTGLRIGRYRIVREIASGGMGTVYEAEQESPKKRVALKVLHAMFASKPVLRRFQVEAEILAQLGHPSIAQVFEAGVHTIEGDGYRVDLPWYSLELLEDARSLTDHADAEGLALDARLRLFHEVCDAVHHAHSRGVVHRDLKPQNILVDRRGKPKVIDFGIARSRGPGGSVPSIRTEIGELVGTLRYMAPEQFAGDPNAIDTRTDVYALGVVLYELVCGISPFELDAKEISEVGRIVREQPPRSPRRANPSVPDEIEWVILRALEKEPSRRYASAAEMRDDLGRYARREPLLAGPPSAAYRAKKFIARNRFAVGAASAVLVTLIGGLVASLVSLRLAKQAALDAQVAEDKADSEAKAARAAQKLAEDNEAVSKFVTGLFEQAIDAAAIGKKGPDLRVVDVLASMSQHLAETAVDNPAIAAKAHGHLAELYYSLSEMEGAERHFRARITSLEAAGETPHAIATCRQNLAQILLRRGDASGAMEELEHVRVFIEAEGEADTELASTYHQRLGTAHRMNRKLDLAEQEYRKAVDIARHRLGDTHEETLDAVNALSTLLMDLGRFDEAEPLAREVVDGVTKNNGSEHPFTLMAITNLATLFGDRGDWKRALELLEPLLDVRTRVSGPDHADTLELRVAIAQYRWKVGREDDALALTRDHGELFRKRFGAAHPATLRAAAQHTDYLILREDFAGIELAVGRALEGVSKEGADSSVAVFFDKLAAARGYAEVMGNHDEAGLVAIDAAIASATQYYGANHGLVKMYQRWKKKAEAKLAESGG